MSAAFNDIAAAITARLAAGFTSTSIAYQNMEFNQTPGTPFVSLAVHIPGNNLISVGNPTTRLMRYSGTIEIDIFIPSAQGTGDAYTYADQLTTLFQLQKFSGVQCYEPRLGISVDRMKDIAGGEFFMLPWFCPFEYDVNA